MSLRSTLSPLSHSPLPIQMSNSLEKEDLFGDFSEEEEGNSPEVLKNEITMNIDPVNDYGDNITDSISEEIETVVSIKLQEMIDKVCGCDNKQSNKTNAANVKGKRHFTRSNFVEVKPTVNCSLQTEQPVNVDPHKSPNQQPFLSENTNVIESPIESLPAATLKTTIRNTSNIFKTVLATDQCSPVKDERTVNNQTDLHPLKNNDLKPAQSSRNPGSAKKISESSKKITDPSKKNNVSNTVDIFKTILNNNAEDSLSKTTSNIKLKHNGMKNESMNIGKSFDDSLRGVEHNNSESLVSTPAAVDSLSELTANGPTPQETSTSKVSSSPHVVLVDVQHESKHKHSNSSTEKLSSAIISEDSSSSCLDGNSKIQPKHINKTPLSITTTLTTQSNPNTNELCIVDTNSNNIDIQQSNCNNKFFIKKSFIKSAVSSNSHTSNNIIKPSSNTYLSSNPKKSSLSEISSKSSASNVSKHNPPSHSSTATMKSSLRRTTQGNIESPSNMTTLKKKKQTNSSLFVGEEDLRPPGVDDDDDDEEIFIIPNDVSPISSPVQPIHSPIVTTRSSTSTSNTISIGNNSSSTTSRNESISNETISRISLGSPQPTLSPLPPPNFRIRSSVVHASHTSHVSTVQRYPSSLHNRQSNRPNSAKKHVTFSNADKIRDIRRKTHSPGMSISPPMSPIPPSPRRNVLTPLISPLPITPLPESISPLPPSPKIMSPPLIRGSAILHSENSSVRMPVPIPRKRASVTQSIDFDKRPKIFRECLSIQKQPITDVDDSCDNSPSAFTKQASCLRKSEAVPDAAVKLVKQCETKPPLVARITSDKSDVDQLTLNENESIPLCVIVPDDDLQQQSTSTVGRCYKEDHNRVSMKRKSISDSHTSKNTQKTNKPSSEKSRKNKTSNESTNILKSDSKGKSATDSDLTTKREFKRIKKESSNDCKMSKELAASSKVTSFSTSNFKSPVQLSLNKKTSAKENTSADIISKPSEITNKKLIQKDNDKNQSDDTNNDKSNNYTNNNNNYYTNTNNTNSDNTNNNKQSSPSSSPFVKKPTKKKNADQADLLNRDTGMSEKFYVLKCVELLQSKKVNTNTIIMSFTKRGNVSSWKCLMTSLVEMSKKCIYSLLEKDIYVEEKNRKKSRTTFPNVYGLQKVCRIPLMTKAEAKWMKIINGVLQTHIFRKGPVELLDEIQTLLFKDIHMKPPQQESLW